MDGILVAVLLLILVIAVVNIVWPNNDGGVYGDNSDDY